MSLKTITMTDSLYEYLLANTLREPEVLQKLREETAKLSMGRMQISPEQGQFMRLLIELIGARKTLEIGVFTGYSSISVALSLPDDGKIIACDVSEEWTSIAKKYWQKAGVEQKINLKLAPALETLEQLINQGESGTFDFAFIDADKANYLAYYEKAIILLRQGGLVAIDNVLWHGDVANPNDKSESTEAIRKLNQRVHADDRVSISLVPIGDGLMLARKI